MSQIDGSIAELAPNGVTFKSLGEITDVRSGWGFPNADQGMSEGAYPFYKVSDMNGRGNQLVMGSANNYVDEATARRLGVALAPAGTVIFPKIGAAVATNKKRLLSRTSAYDNNVMGLIPGAELLPKFLLYWMQTLDLARISNDSGAVPSIRKSEMQLVRMPVPPRAVQAEIVRILDQFTELEIEVIAELEARKQQRSALARSLLGAPYFRTPDGGDVERIRLGEVATQWVEPVRVQSEVAYTNLGVKWYSEGAFARDSKLGGAIKGTTLYRVKPGQLIYNRMFVTEGSFAVIPPKLAEGVVSNEFPVYDLDSSRVIPEWLLLYFQDEYTLKRIAGEVTGTERGSTKSRRRWKEDQFEAFEIELPSVPAQREFLRVVGTVADLESALNDELVARRRQFEFYRDKLLTFEEAAS